MARNKLVTLNQVITKRRQNRQIWDANDGVTLRRKAMQIKWLQDVKESTPRLNDDLGIIISCPENFVKEKKNREKLAEEISQLLTRRGTLIDKLKY